jgi:hypothetical protein
MSSPVSDFLDALAKLPAFNGITFRGLGPGDEAPPPLGVVTGVLASSRDPRVASENFSAPLLVLLNRTGRSIAAFSAQPDEHEVVVRPGTLWQRLIDVSIPALPTPVMVLEELDMSQTTPRPTEWGDTLAELSGRVTRLVEQALGSPTRVVAVPGKFAGPWPAQVPQQP